MTSVKRNVDREGWGSGVVNPTPGSQTVKRATSMTIARAIAATSTLTSTVHRGGLAIAKPFPVFGPLDLKGLGYPGMNGDKPLLHPYRRGVGMHAVSTPRPLVKGPCWLPRRAKQELPIMSHGASEPSIPQLCVAFKSFQTSHGGVPRIFGYPSRLGAARVVRPVTALNHPIPNSLSAGSPPRGPYRRREGFGSRASYLPHYRDNQNRNVSHLNLLSGSAPTPLVRVNPGREFFGNARKVIRKFRKNV